jgi:PAS domain S-box-containing protein
LLILKKPFDTIEVLQLANALTEKWQLLQESKLQLDDLERLVRERTSELEESRKSALEMMEDAVRSREKAERAYEELTREAARRLKLEAQFREQASLLDKARDAIMVRDLDHRITYWNKSAERLYGWTAAEALGRSAVELLHKDPAAFARAWGVVMSTGEWMGELQNTSREGRELIVEGHWTLVRDSEGRPQSVLAINTDVTEKKQIEAQFLRSQRMESVGRLSSGIAHDLNNILTPILLSAYMLRQEVSPDEMEKSLSTIETSTQRGADLIKQLLTFGRGSGGAGAVIQPDSLVQEVVKIVEGTFPKNITIAFRAQKDGWPVTGDATQLHQVLLNLCVNARDAMTEGGALSLSTENVRLDESNAAMSPEAKAGPYVLLRVSDTGEGIPPHIVDRIFDPFFTTKENGKGTGLGLSTVLGIVRNHRGFVCLRSREGDGTTFDVYLPAAPGAVEATIAAALPAAPKGCGETILVVDDEPGIRDVTEKTLRAHGYSVLTAADGTEGIALYCQRHSEIKAVLTDVMMPCMDGMTMARILKGINPSLRIVASSGIGSAGNREEKVRELHAMGVKTFLTKPYTADVILTAIGEVLMEEEAAVAAAGV